MLDRFGVLLHKLRRALSRSEWTIRLLGLPRSPDAETRRGIVMIQIDGLSHDIAKSAIEEGRMPFLRHLIEDEGFNLEAMFSGVPSTTPSVQGELFYGVRGIVPAFSFVDRKTGRVMRMYERDSADTIERTLAGEEGLLAGGSAYCDIYSGAAENTRFCASTGGMGDLVRSKWPAAIPFLAAAHVLSLVRIALLVPLEFLLATWDFVRGVVKGYDLWMELKFVPTRVAICILLREMIVIGAKVDIARGLPVVQLNLIGYDEQAHRRGPASGFALWTLKGIDHAISRIARASRRSLFRDYDVWIYSDHGQEETVSYLAEHGRTVQEAVAEVLSKHDYDTAAHDEPAHGVQLQRVSMVSESLVRAFLAGAAAGTDFVQPSKMAVAAMGPLGHVYVPSRLPDETMDKVARELVAEACIPLVLTASGDNGAKAWTEDGIFELPRDSKQVLGADHPYADAAAEDLARLCHHRYAGDIVISGLRPDGPCVSFPRENGAHAGPGPQETSAFVLVPGHTQLTHEEGSPLRPGDLREEGLRILGRSTMPPTMPHYRKHPEDTLRVMTYNVHSCVGMDGKLSPERIARVIAQYEPDIVALQELDVGRVRSNEVDQAHFIGEMLEMLVHFHPAISVEEEHYGDAVLSRYPMELVQAKELPRLPAWPNLEPRGAMWVDIELHGRVHHFFNTHLSLHPWERRLQASSLVGEDWLDSAGCSGRRIMCGDFNAGPRSPVCRRIGKLLSDSQIAHKNHRPKRTFHSRYPVGRIDHVFVERGVDIVHIEIPSTQLTRVASDHLPLIVEFRID